MCVRVHAACKQQCWTCEQPETHTHTDRPTPSSPHHTQGLAAAAATRQAVKQSHATAATADPSAPPPAKKKAAAAAAARPPPTLVHDVLTPPGYDDATAEDGLDPAVHGECVGGWSWAGARRTNSRVEN